jgi:UDP-2,3-diacylglucosamine pyrophosphatase LpxH
VKQPKFVLSCPSPNVTEVRDTVPSMAGWERWYLLRSDAHHDNPKCDQALERKHLQQAAERDAGVLDFGDLFCAMQGKYDRRASKKDVRPENQTDDYLRSLVNTAANFYEPFAHNFVLFGRGNHEASILHRHEFDLTAALVERLADRTKTRASAGGYSGWVRFMFQRGRETCSRRLWFIHGYGGGGPVTLDTIQANRQQAYVENADFIVSGHTHDSFAIPRQRIRLNDASRVEQRTLWHIKCGTYKDEYGVGEGGWQVETGKPPKTLGAWWLRFYWDGHRGLREQLIRAD